MVSLIVDIPVPDRETGMLCPVDYLNSVKISSMPQHKLVLKKGAPVICLRNVSFSDGVCNGTRFIVESMTHHILVVKFASGRRKGEFYAFHRMEFTPDEADFPVRFHRTQFPVRLAFAFTAHKAQGQTLSMVGISMISEFFSHS